MRLPLVFTLAVLLPALLVDLYIYCRLPKAALLCGRKMGVRQWYLLSVVVTQSLLVLSICLPKRDGEVSILPVMWMLYAWLSVYLPKLLYVLCDLPGGIPLLFHRRRWPLGKYVGLPLAVLCFGAMWWGAIFGRRQIAVNEVEIVSEKLPASFDGVRIAQFSDAHVGTWGSDTTFISEFVDRINALAPDVIVFTGDIVNRQTDEIYPFVEVLSRLHAPMGVYSVMGNHDYGDYADWPSSEAHAANTRKLREIESRMGWRLLDNEHMFLHKGNDSIALIGVENWGEPPFKQYGRLDKAYPHSSTGVIADSTFKILLTHNPMHWHEKVRHETDIDLTLSGHTHAMQIMIGKPGTGFSPGAKVYPEWGGLYEFGRKDGGVSRIYVNIGCGQVAIPARVGASPEITLLTLRCGR